MKLFEARTDADSHPGRWFPAEPEREPAAGEDYDPHSAKNGAHVAFLVRPLSDDVAQRIDREVFGNMPLGGGGRGRRRRPNQTKVAELVEEAQKRKACWAFLDTAHAEMVPQDAEVAATVARAVGQEVSVGALVSLDGHWTDELRRQLFRWNRDAYNRIVEIMLRSTGDEAEEERGKGES